MKNLIFFLALITSTTVFAEIPYQGCFLEENTDGYWFPMFYRRLSSDAYMIYNATDTQCRRLHPLDRGTKITVKEMAERLENSTVIRYSRP